MTTYKYLKSLAAGGSLLALFIYQPASAATLTWDTTISADATITDGAGTWNTGTGNWNNGTTSVGVNFATGDNVTFGNGGTLSVNPTTITLGSSPLTVGSLTFNYNGTGVYALGATANTQAIAFTGGTGTVSVLGNPSFTPIINTQLNGNFTVTAATAGKGITLVANNTQTSANTITVSANTLLQVGSNGSSGTAGSANIANNGSLIYRRSGTLTMTNAISGTGTVAYQLRSNTTNLNTAGTYTGATSFSPTGADALASTVNWGVTNVLPTTTALSILTNTNSSITLDLKGFNQTVTSLTGAGTTTNSIITSTSGTPTLTVNGTTSTSYSGLLSGSVNLQRAGTGTLTLAAANTFTGTTTISSGGLTLGAAGSLNNSSLVTVGNGATFTNNNASAATAALALNEGATLAGTGTFTPASLSITADLSNGFTAIAGGQLLTKSGALTFNLSGLTAGSYTLFSGSPGASSFSSVSIAASALSTNNGGVTYTGNDISGFNFTFTNATNVLQVSAVPEPSTYAALAGIAMLGWAAARRRRQ